MTGLFHGAVFDFSSTSLRSEFLTSAESHVKLSRTADSKMERGRRPRQTGSSPKNCPRKINTGDEAVPAPILTDRSRSIPQFPSRPFSLRAKLTGNARAIAGGAGGRG